jgi:hypothetical protein
MRMMIRRIKVVTWVCVKMAVGGDTLHRTVWFIIIMVCIYQQAS